jgi:hypothetical protein
VITYEIGIGLTGTREVIAGASALRALRGELDETGKSAKAAGGAIPRAVSGGSGRGGAADKQAKEIEQQAKRQAAAREYVFQLRQKQEERESKSEAKVAADRARARDHVLGIRQKHEDKETRAESKAAAEFGKAKEYVFQIRQRQEAAERKAEEKTAAELARERDKRADKEASAEKKRIAKRSEAEKKSREKVSTGIKIAGVAAGAVGVAGFAGMAQMALGARTVGQLQMMAMRAQFNFRQLFKGVDSTPVLRAFDRLTQNFSKTTSTGRLLSSVLTRGFTGAFALIERAEPYFTAFGQGMLGAGLDIEYGFIQARMALLPVEFAIRHALEGVDGLSLAATAGSVVFKGLFAAAVYSAGSSLIGFTAHAFRAGVSVGRFGIAAVRAVPGIISMGASAAVAAAPWILFAGAIASVGAALYEAIELYKVWDDQSAGQLFAELKRDLGFGKSEADLDREAGIKTADLMGESAAAKAAKEGKTTGEAFGDGIVLGLKEKEAALTNSGLGAAKAVDTGVKVGGKIRSPSRLMRENAHYMGDGAILGMRDKAPEVQKEAVRSFVPSLAGAGAGSPSASSSSAQSSGPRVLQVIFQGPVGGSEANIERAVLKAMRVALNDAAIQMAAAVAT